MCRDVLKKRARISLRTVVLPALFISVLACGSVSFAQPVGDIALGVALDKMADQVDQAIIDAKNSGNSLEMEGGRQIAIAIANAKNAYADSLDTAISKLDPEIKSSFDQLSQLESDFSNHLITTVDDATSRAQQVVNALPFRNGEPQVTQTLPRFVVPSAKSYPVIVRVLGNFVDAGKEDFTPYIQLGNAQYRPVNTKTQELDFAIPADKLFPVEKQSDITKFNFTNLTINVPWRESHFLGIWHSRELDAFNLIIGALPRSPGKIVMTHTDQVDVVDQRTYAGPNHHQCSTRECGNNDDKDHHWQDTPDNNWTLVRGTVQLHVGSAQGDHSGPSLISDDGNVAITTATTIHHGWGGSSGSIDFNVTFDETSTHKQPRQTPLSVTLLWGDSKAFSFPAGSWSLAFDSFDGHHNEYAGADSTNPFINIRLEEGSVIVETKDPATIAWP